MMLRNSVRDYDYRILATTMTAMVSVAIKRVGAHHITLIPCRWGKCSEKINDF